VWFSPNPEARSPGLKVQIILRGENMAVFFDTHAHLDYPDYASDLPQVVARAEAAGITRMISIGTDLVSSQRAIQLSEEYPQIYAAVGWHPSNVLEAPDDFRSALRTLAAHPRVVAIGETGLDHFRLPGGPAESAENTRYKERQASLFEQHLEVASELGLNCVIHQRAAMDATLMILRSYAAKVRGVFHCFADNVEALQRVLALGSIVSFTGILTFKNGQNIRETLAAAPFGHFMLETDSPYLAPVPYRGKRCEPAYVREISQVAAQVKNCSEEELSTATCATARAFFKGLS